MVTKNKTFHRWADVKEEMAIRAEVRLIVRELEAIRRRILALAARSEKLPGYVEAVAANAGTGDLDVMTPALELNMDLCWAGSDDDDDGIASVIDRLKACVERKPKKRRAAAARRPR